MKTLVTSKVLPLPRCPHCNVASPNLESVHAFNSEAGDRKRAFKWKVFVCTSCGKPVVAGCSIQEDLIQDDLVFPTPRRLHTALPARVHAFLKQAIESLHAPAGSVMLCASAVDAMLKESGLKAGSLHRRIEEAAEKNLITEGMAKWAHAVRLDANDQRHADDNAELPTPEDAQRSIDFAMALGEFLFVLPSRIESGLKPQQPADNQHLIHPTPVPPAPRPAAF